MRVSIDQAGTLYQREAFIEWAERYAAGVRHRLTEQATRRMYGSLPPGETAVGYVEVVTRRLRFGQA